ncbi:flavodoxin-like fold family protein [Listeria floridensis FSL S10-1187]|uniref:Flavodoxin-like fold family protein n=1 Tax=Listeria floridensis FSL S10-1187 TaxID=1265817 RepID=A0ABN0RGX7_9LIST|nr:NAD(P)H-dependent oxidoreductase [Listeria floridensis]EUJ33168.1 flavodoxin-like fold family protein [Listeria floridensis FSL S10-1187]
MKTVIVYNHPYNGSFCHALLESAQKGAERAGHEVEIIDLDADQFNPVMSGADLLAFREHKMIDSQALHYAKAIQQANHLVLIFPIWWELMPAMMKGFIDKVIFPGSTYTYTKSGYRMKTLLPNLQTTTVVTTMNTPKVMYTTVYGNAIKKALIQGTLKKSGIKKVKWLSFNMVKNSSSETRTKWLKQVEQTFTKNKR